MACIDRRYCKYEIAFHGIKYKKIAKKTYQFNIPDHSGTIGTITLDHCKCHNTTTGTRSSDNTYDLKTLNFSEIMEMLLPILT